LQHLDIFVRCFFHFFSAERMKHAFFRLKGDDDILSYRKVGNDTLCFTVFRKIRHTKLHSVQRTVDLHFFAVYFQRTAVSLVGAVNSTHQLRTSGAEKTCKTDNLALVDSDIEGFDGSSVSKSPGLDNRSRRRGFLSCVSALDIGKIVEILTHHLCYQHDAGQILGLIFSYKLAVTEDCDPVAYRVYLLQEMCYE